MQPNIAFVEMPKKFWANVRTISQEVGYVERPNRSSSMKGRIGSISVPSTQSIVRAYERLSLSSRHIVDELGVLTPFGEQLHQYFTYRADILNQVVEPQLMTAETAKKCFEKLRNQIKSIRSVPMNKQSGDKKKIAYFTAIINLLVERELNGLPCNFNPLELTAITRHNEPFRTFARRIDGAFPSPINPIAIWEIKEYYHTTTFGSRIADGVYETLLDGMELEEMNAAIRAEGQAVEAKPIQHVLMVDAHFTWWVKGRSYLCRLIDMLHMGYVDEILFGSEVLLRLPQLVNQWIAEYHIRIRSLSIKLN